MTWRAGSVIRGGLRAAGFGALLALLVGSHPQAASAAGDAIDPPVYVSHDGILAATLTASAQTVTLAGVSIPGLVFNGSYAGPVLRVRPGDRMLIRLVNKLPEPTNLHFHGMYASPLGRSDNVHVAVPPGESFLYMVRIPAAQPPGLYWYHAHIHGISERQIMSGLSGPLIVEGFAEQFPGAQGVREQLMVLKEYEFDDSEDPIIDGELHERLQTINGRTDLALTMRPHETQLWRFVNEDANRLYHISVPGHEFRIIGQDGMARSTESREKVLHIPPASRIEALIDAGEAGSYKLVSENTLTGTARVRVLGAITVAGEPAAPITVASPRPVMEDLRQSPISARREVVFTQDAEAGKYFVNGQLYDHDRLDTRVPLGSIEEWTIKNDSDEMHAFHIHQLHFQVVAINGKPVPFDGGLDTVKVPERGSVTLRIPFVRPEMVGRFVYHCHVLKHEDKGMMANIEVYDPNPPPPSKVPTGFWFASLKRASNAGAIPYEFCGPAP